jgi:rSAM-associated Gly-rich repeat protein
MPGWNRLAKALAVVLPAGAFGASVVLAAATQTQTPSQPSNGQGVSIRLQEIRSGISDMTGSADDGSGDAKATPAWWGNGGWGRWRLGWGNGGFGWHNGGWGNGGWPNWHNGGGWGNGGGWPNWHNGWHNFWHNW